jgi:hypothetical protein
LFACQHTGFRSGVFRIGVKAQAKGYAAMAFSCFVGSLAVQRLFFQEYA